MKSRVIICLAFLSACSYTHRPTPVAVEQNYETGIITKTVRLGWKEYPPFALIREQSQSARERLLADIRRECPNARLLGEGSQGEDRLWVRYRCEQEGASSFQPPPAVGIPHTAEEMSAATFRAMTKQCGEAYARGMNAAQELQDARLQTGGFSLQEQGAIAVKLLTDDLLDDRTRVYLGVLGFTVEREQQGRADYLQMMNLSSTTLRQ